MNRSNIFVTKISRRQSFAKQIFNVCHQLQPGNSNNCSNNYSNQSRAARSAQAKNRDKAFLRELAKQQMLNNFAAPTIFDARQH
jgi:hypothetical protein